MAEKPKPPKHPKRTPKRDGPLPDDEPLTDEEREVLRRIREQGTP